MMKQGSYPHFIAKVIGVEYDKLFVFDYATNQAIIVHTKDAYQFLCGDCLWIEYSGAMTKSIPPQITAINIQKYCPCKC